MEVKWKLKGSRKELIIETLKPIFFWFIQLDFSALFLSDKPKNSVFSSLILFPQVLLL